LLGTFLSRIDATGLYVAEADFVAVLLYQVTQVEGSGDNRQVIKGKGKQRRKKGKGKEKGFGKKRKMNEVGYENDYDGTVLTCGGRTMVLGGRTSLGLKLHKSGMTVGMSLGTVHGTKDKRIGTDLGVGLQLKTSSKVQVLAVQLKVSNR